MKITNYFPAKNLVLLEAIKTKESASGNIILAQEEFVGYYKIVKTGPLCEQAKVGEYAVSTLQMGVEVTFEEGTFMQLPEQGIDGYYQPGPEELKKPIPQFTSMVEEQEEEMNIIDSEGGNNELGTQFGNREY